MPHPSDNISEDITRTGEHKLRELFKEKLVIDLVPSYFESPGGAAGGGLGSIGCYAARTYAARFRGVFVTDEQRSLDGCGVAAYLSRYGAPGLPLCA